MHIHEQTPSRFVLQHRRQGMAIAIAIFTVMSIVFSGALLAQGIARFALLDSMQRVGWVLWQVLAFGFAYVGWQSWMRAGRSITCIFDREAETVQIHQPHLWHSEPRILSIYAISHLHMQSNEEARVIGIFLVLRSSERISLGTVPPYDKESIQTIQTQLKQFLNQPAATS